MQLSTTRIHDTRTEGDGSGRDRGDTRRPRSSDLDCPAHLGPGVVGIVAAAVLVVLALAASPAGLWAVVAVVMVVPLAVAAWLLVAGTETATRRGR